MPAAAMAAVNSRRKSAASSSRPSRVANTNPVSRPSVLGSVSLTVFPAVGLAGLSGPEPVAEGNGNSVQRGLPPHRPPGLAGPQRDSHSGRCRGTGGRARPGVTSRPC
jgi:hypothetical protein